MSKNKKRKPIPLLAANHHFIDTHCHLDMDQYSDDVEAIIKRAQAVGVSSIITIGIDVESSQKAVSISSTHENVFAAVGIHPHYAPECDELAVEQIRAMAMHKKVIAYGEIGIDRYKDYAPVADQIKAFTLQLELAKELGLPVIIHDREAHDEILTILKNVGPFPSAGVIHCFSGDKTVARKFLDLGFYLSVPGVVTFKKAIELHEATASIPLDRLLIETDGPFLAPEPFRGKRNEPSYALYTAEKVAGLKNVTLEELADATTKNVQNLFKIKI